MDRNPSPPLRSRDEEEEEEAAVGDCIGSTVYSKHWLFGVLTGLMQVWKLAPRVGSLHVPPAPPPASGSPLLPGEPPSPRQPPPQAPAAGSHPLRPCCLPDPKTAVRRSLCPSTQREV